MTVNYLSGPRKFTLTPSRKALGKTLGRANRRSFAKHAVHDRRIRGFILANMSKVRKNEIRQLCSESVLLRSTKEDLCSFSWSHVCEELNRRAPCILSLLKSCIPESSPFDKQAIACTCLAILVKARRQSACLVQKVVSLILYAGHTSKQVSDLIHSYSSIGAHTTPTATLKSNNVNTS